MKNLLIKLIIFSLSFLFLNCQSEKAAIKKNYNFKTIKKILVIKFSGPRKYPNSGDIVADMITFNLLKLNYDVMGRELISRNEKFKSIMNKAKEYNVDAIITGSVTKYSLEQKIHKIDKSKKEIHVKGSDSTEINITEEEKELVYSSGRVLGATTDLPYEVQATVGIIAKMIDVETGETIWINRAESSGFTIEAAVESAVDALISSFNE